jgi:hypothetical protein
LLLSYNFSTANEILVRLRQRFHSVDAMVKASHLLRYSCLKQKLVLSLLIASEQKDFIALREMGINVDDSLRLTKFIQQDTTNSKHKSQAQTIFSTPNMTFSRATSLFETYHSGEQTLVESSAPSVNAIFCNYCQKKGHKVKVCKKKITDEKNKKAKDFQRFFIRFFSIFLRQKRAIFVLYLQGQRTQNS